jgi:hypothetical protein
MRGSPAVPALVIAALALGCGGSPASGPSRQTVETRVTANGEEVLLRWSPRHPWDADLMANGALLVAEYRDRDGDVGVDCLGGGPPRSADPRARGRAAPTRGAVGCAGLAGELVRSREDRTLRFRLPQATTATPEGPVCLYFRLPNQRVLPVRRADRHETETARFRHASWEAAASRQAQRRALETRVEQLRQGSEVKARDIAAQEGINARNGWSSRSACAAIQAPAVGHARAERPPTPPEERVAVARRVCTMRVWYADSLAAASPNEQAIRRQVVQPPAAVERLFAMLPQGQQNPAAAARRHQVAEFRRDWAQLAPTIREYRDQLRRDGWGHPHFGSFGDVLMLQRLTREAAARVEEAASRRQRPDPRDVAGVAGGMLEAYTRCVADGQAQLATAHQAAVELQRRAPEVREGVRQRLVRDCQGGIDKLASLQAEHAALLAELREAEAALATFPAIPALAARPQDLNAAACTP